MLNKYYTLQEISEKTHTSVPYLKGLIKEGVIKAILISKSYLITEYELLKFLEQQEVKYSENKIKPKGN